MVDEISLEPRFVVWHCDHCRNRIEFDAVQLAGRAACRVSCPHCGLETSLQEPPPPPPLVLDEGWTQPVEAEIIVGRELEKNMAEAPPPVEPPPPVRSEIAEPIAEVPAPTPPLVSQLIQAPEMISPPLTPEPVEVQKPSEPPPLMVQIEEPPMPALPQVLPVEHGESMKQAPEAILPPVAPEPVKAHPTTEPLPVVLTEEPVKESAIAVPPSVVTPFQEISPVASTPPIVTNEPVQQPSAVAPIPHTSFVNRPLRPRPAQAPVMPKSIKVTLPPDPLPPTHTRAPVDVRWITDLGVVYFRQHQFGEAFLCFNRAAEQGFATAQFCLAVCYFNGHGTPQDEAAALPWLLQAAKQGDANAEFTLGLAYRLGRGVKSNPVFAIQWLQKAAAHGHPEAIAQVGKANPIENPGPKKTPGPILLPIAEPASEKNPAKSRHDLQRLILGLFRKK